jgi:hypothetical protein
MDRKIIQLIEHNGKLLALDDHGVVWIRTRRGEFNWYWKLHSFNVLQYTDEELVDLAKRGEV